MSISGTIILIAMSLFAIYCMVGKNGRGYKNYVIRNSVGVYILILGLLSILRSGNGLIQSLYLGLFSVLLAFLSLIIFKKEPKRCQILNIIGIVVSTYATYLSYIN
ncbi:hypothetical protein [Peptostreptococcus faecalis]|uniref:hypothetical protein n=1 Tax=Peptostreptococcus faecalis TaxID=2045015 RepID=UPI000C7B105F|nr:hypothetical protein [Peptostreptococcus faecalis]